MPATASIGPSHTTPQTANGSASSGRAATTRRTSRWSAGHTSRDGVVTRSRTTTSPRSSTTPADKRSVPTSIARYVATALTVMVPTAPEPTGMHRLPFGR